MTLSLRTAPDLRAEAAAIERRADYWLRCSNEAFGAGDGDLGRACEQFAVTLCNQVSDLGERAAVLEARWPEDTAGELFTQQIGARL